MSGADTEASATALWTKHQGAIMSLRAYAGSGEASHRGRGALAQCGFAAQHSRVTRCLAPRLVLCAAAGKTHSFSTSGNDGRVVVWDIKALPHLPAAGLGL